MRRLERRTLSTSEQGVYVVAFRFLRERLDERETMEWALNLGHEDKAKKLALCELLGSQRERNLTAPWREAWHLVIENWTRPVIERNGHIGVYEVRERLNTGEYTKGLVSEIVKLVTPRLNIRMVGDAHRVRQKRAKILKTRDELISCTLTSGPIVDIDEFKLENIANKDFLFTLASALDDLLVASLDLARRIGWNGENNYWIVGQLNRVYYVHEKDEDRWNNEPDKFGDGIVPAVKLLYEVVARLADVEINRATSFVTRWKPTDSQIHLRLLAALYRDQRMASKDILDAFFAQLNHRQFWDLRNYPEVAELRAKRFNELNPKIQTEILKRIIKGPPRSYWSRAMDKDRLKVASQYNAVREMKRIRLAGGKLSEKDITWLEERLPRFPELVEMEKIEGGFPETVKAGWIESTPNLRFDALEGEARLRALEIELTQKRSWFDDEGNAEGWIRVLGNCLQLISDFESVGDSGATYPNVWENFGWAHTPTDNGVDAETRDVTSEMRRVLALLENLKSDTISKSIDGISYWLSRWGKQLLDDQKGLSVWRKIWPHAVAATNAEKVEDEVDLRSTVRIVDNSESKDLDTLNNPSGRLISAFTDSCPTLTAGVMPFVSEQPLKEMRDIIFSSTGRSLLIAQYRFVESLSYFLQADQEWTEKNLIRPLMAQNFEAVVLWQAISRRIHRQQVLQIIGEEMVNRALDLRLGRENRCMLVRNLVIDSLHAYWLARRSSVERYKVQQMLRLVEDEVRISGAEILHQFIQESSNPSLNPERPTPNPEDLYSKAVKPFLREIWPQEKSLATQGLSQALADLPATTGQEFSEAVNLIERFLVPFDCWSLMDFGFYGADDTINLSQIDSHDKAEALLRMLDKSIGTQENAVAPYDLAIALDRICEVSPQLTDARSFRRLEAVSRR